MNFTGRARIAATVLLIFQFILQCSGLLPESTNWRCSPT
jgi:hypothetical protein